MKPARTLLSLFVAAVVLASASLTLAQTTSTAPAAGTTTVTGKLMVAKDDAGGVKDVTLKTADAEYWVMDGDAKVADLAAHAGHEVVLTGMVEEKDGKKWLKLASFHMARDEDDEDEE